jgi:FkbM family methyltransferase
MRNVSRFHGSAHRLLETLLPDKVLPLPLLTGPLKGFFMRINLRWELQFVRSTFEPEVAKTLVDLVKPGNVVYDVGAHVGYYTLLFCRLAGPEGHCIAFEPNHKVFHRLESNIQLNQRRLKCKVDAIDVALHSEPGQKEFFVGGSTSTGRLVRFPKGVPEGAIVTVPVTTIDHLVGAGMPLPDVIKIDVEYVEDHVLRGAVHTLSNHPAVIVCEIHSMESGVTCFTILKDLSYTIRHIETGRPWDSIDSVSKGHIIAFPEPWPSVARRGMPWHTLPDVVNGKQALGDTGLEQRPM